MRKAASIALGASSGSTNRAAKNVSTTRLKLMSPIPSVTGQHQHEHALDGRVAQVEDRRGSARPGPAATTSA